jgi:hypothetical protein
MAARELSIPIPSAFGAEAPVVSASSSDLSRLSLTRPERDPAF